MNADFLAILEFWEREKGISKDVLVGAVQEALVSAAKKAVGPARELRCLIGSPLFSVERLVVCGHDA